MKPQKLKQHLRLIAPWQFVTATLTPFFFSAIAFAQEAAEEGRGTSFKQIKGATGDEIPGGMLTIIAYALILVGIFFYVHRIASAQRRVEKELSEMRESKGKA